MSDVNFQFPRKAIERVINRAPNIANRVFNREYKAIAREYSRRLDRDVFGRKGPYKIDTKRGKARQPKDSRQPKLHNRVALAGFRARIRPADKITDKRLRFWTKNPLILQRQYGATLVPRRHPVMQLDFPRRGRGGPDIVYTRRVVIKPTLGLDRVWDGMAAFTRDRHRKAIEESARQWNREFDRSARRQQRSRRRAA